MVSKADDYTRRARSEISSAEVLFAVSGSAKLKNAAHQHDSGMVNACSTEKFISVTQLVTIVTKMMSIFRSGPLKILRLFYTDKAARLHLREIARRAKLHEPSTTAFLGLLEKDGMLKHEKDGNQKKYSLRLNTRTYGAFQLLDMERLDALPSIRRNAIKYFIEALKEKPLIALVFGSTAKGTYKDTSDIDLFIVTNTKISTEAAIKHAEALTAIKISIFQMTLADFSKEIKLKEEPVIQSALASGYPVLNNLYYYEVLYNGHPLPEPAVN